ncbi:glutamate-5-semialdehyde dehydrogenase [Chitinophaga pinensis]|uniref:Gamma-glutamyl phosphate reductase n=1 Tax=Chitinophaga pinensis (strain ATCC 43595 / DSM 2588 / LMG 13176 / NBRC 15968 / NCIMB 11800 / UQM 2034) TaxID=485918 RepID=A0A979GB78_CHIPD|nr:glutamate-5-semialdehyde dehydrogenase [Chitinophaga pinensis]ACU64215.1 gamma-glutamyl phosphate reductase [Chitinophaga pinensis DSM 2588]
MESIQPLLEKAQAATRSLKTLPDAQKQELLRKLSTVVEAHTDAIVAENKKDLDKMSDQDPKKDRLLLNTARIKQLADSLNDIAGLQDPANQLLVERTLDNGLQVQKRTVPLGVVGVIYESRPNVTLDVAALCIRSGNVAVLRGGTDAFHTNIILVDLIQQVLKEFNADPNAVQLLPVDRALIGEMLTAVKYIDIIIPRGSQQLIDYVRANSKVPVIETGAGVCHTYVEKTADLKKASAIITNAKVSRPSVCNALDTVLVDKEVAPELLRQLADSLQDYDVEIFADELSFNLLQALEYPYLIKATPADFGREFLDYKCSVKVVDGLEDALQHIQEYSSKHSEAIVSQDTVLSERFLNEVDAAAVYVNASTRFTDGGVFGLGAEIGISTQKLHARGPFALEKLVTEKWFVRGDGQVR